MSHLYMVKAEMQHAADAAALAVPRRSTPRRGHNARGHASTVQMNKADFNTTTSSSQRQTSSSPQTSPILSSPRRQCATWRTEYALRPSHDSCGPCPLYFARIILGSTFNVTATATAGQSIALNVICGIAPVSVIDFDTPLSPAMSTRSGSPVWRPSPGNYQILGSGRYGGKSVEQGLAGAAPICAKAGEEYALDTSPGVKSGPVRKGLNSRFDDYSGTTSARLTTRRTSTSITTLRITNIRPVHPSSLPLTRGCRVVVC
jgi:hypothetical protein